MDALGFMFYGGSPRHVSAEAAALMSKFLPPFISKVGVFVNPTEQEVRSTLAVCPLDVLQFHGDETPEFCDRFNVPVIKAFRIRDCNSLPRLESFPVHAWLLDAYVEGTLGGTGKTFNWDLAAEAVRMGRPVVLAGGLNPSNVAEAVGRVRPYAVDVSSGVEISPGLKDPDQIRAIVGEVRHANHLPR